MAEKILTGADNDLCTKHNNEANDGNYRNGDNKLEHEDNDDESDDCNDNDDVPPPPLYGTEPNGQDEVPTLHGTYLLLPQRSELHIVQELYGVLRCLLI